MDDKFAQAAAELVRAGLVGDDKRANVEEYLRARDVLMQVNFEPRPMAGSLQDVMQVVAREDDRRRRLQDLVGRLSALNVLDATQPNLDQLSTVVANLDGALGRLKSAALNLEAAYEQVQAIHQGVEGPLRGLQERLGSAPVVPEGDRGGRKRR